MAHRFHRDWGNPTFHPELIEDPYRVKKPASIFVASTSDLFHPELSFVDVQKIWDTMFDCDRHTFVVLTKRPERMALFAEWMDKQCFRRIDYPNVWLGVTAEDQQRADERIPILLTIPAAVHFVSVEPMLEQINLMPDMNPSNEVSLDWVIAGPETGAKKRPCDPEWLVDIEAQCELAEVPFFDKREGTNRTREYPK